MGWHSSGHQWGDLSKPRQYLVTLSEVYSDFARPASGSSAESSAHRAGHPYLDDTARPGPAPRRDGLPGLDCVHLVGARFLGGHAPDGFFFLFIHTRMKPI
jgi:hypothetical protein